MSRMKRSHYCGRLSEELIGQRVTVMGWVQKRRDLGGVIFIDLRDVTGISQVVIDQRNVPQDAFQRSETLRNEYVIAVTGEVERREEGTINENLPTGTIDIRAKDVHILNTAKTPPFMINEPINVREEVRLKYRYLDLRRQDMLSNLKLRQTVLQSVRKFFIERDFLEVETPMLTRSTPEGARDYLVPARGSNGKFYALPQSPQIYKQLLMVGGLEKYFQVAKCFRDEDLRADRQPEFTQVDLEMSFVDEEDIILLLELLFSEILQNSKGISVDLPFRRLTYDEAMDLYGSDKPDLRFDMPMIDMTEIMKTCQFKVFRDVVDQGGIVKGLCVSGGNAFTRSQIEELTQKAINLGGKGMAWIAINPDGSIQSILSKYFSEDDLVKIIQKAKARPGDMIIFSATEKHEAQRILGQLRLEIGAMLGLRKSSDFAFCIVTDFPLLEYSAEAKRYIAMHHPFTMPADENFSDSEAEKVRARSYDIVLNGVELGSGSIRIHNRELQNRIFQLLGFSPEETKDRFGFMLNSFEYGTPPHGGFAFGLDRLIMLLCEQDSIREVIAFPKQKDGSCAMMDAPSTVGREQLMDLDLHVALSNMEEESKTEKISSEVLDYVADLARLSIDEDEREELTKNLQDIIEFADSLASVETTAEDALFRIIENENRFRPDKAKDSLPVETTLKNAPVSKDSCFYVPAAIR